MDEEDYRYAQCFEDGKLDEVEFAKLFLIFNPMVYADGAFFTQEGKLENDEVVRRSICLGLTPWMTRGVSHRSESILDLVRVFAQGELPEQDLCVHLQNGTYTPVAGFMPVKHLCRHRLPVVFDLDARAPAGGFATCRSFWSRRTSSHSRSSWATA